MPELTLANLASLQNIAPLPSGPQHNPLHSQKSFPRSMIQEQALTFAWEKGLRPPHQGGHPLGANPLPQPSSPHGSLHSTSSVRSVLDLWWVKVVDDVRLTWRALG